MTGRPPLFSIVTPVYETPLDVLAETILSVTSQDYASWQLVLIDDVSPSHAVRDALATAAGSDPRITVVLRETNGGISAASNDGVAAATGEFILLLDHDDLLVDGALSDIAAALAADPLIDYLYTDEDKIDVEGRLYETFLKPAWSPERLRSQMYCGHISVLRTALVREVGGFDSAMDGSQDHDLVLRVTERARRVHHLPKVLYHWRALAQSTASSGDAKPYTWEAGLRAVQAHVARIGLNADAALGSWFGTYALERRLDPASRVSVVIPTDVARDPRGDAVLGTLHSVLVATSHRAIDVIVVAEKQLAKSFQKRLRSLADQIAPDVTVRRVPFAGERNESAMFNLGALASASELLVFLRGGLGVVSGDPIAELVAPLEQADVGLTGPLVTFSDGWVRQAGFEFADHRFTRSLLSSRAGESGPFVSLMVDREVSGLDATPSAMRRAVFREVGGFSEALPGALADVDLSFKLRSVGLRVLWVHALRFETDSADAPAAPSDNDLALVTLRWGAPVRDDYLPKPLGRGILVS